MLTRFAPFEGGISEGINTLENVKAKTAGINAGLASGGSLPLPLNCLPVPSGAILSQTISLSRGLITLLGQLTISGRG